MYSILYLCLLLAFANAQQNPKVVQTDLIHLKSQASGPFIPLVQFSLENQTINALFDTGSSDIIVPQKGSSICQNPAQHSTLQATFVNGTEFNGDFAALDLAMDGQTVTGTTVGIFTSGSLPPDAPLFPIFGVGPVQAEAVGSTQPQHGRKLRRQAGNFANLYPNLPAHMKEIGMIKSNAFSVYTDDARAKTGSIVYGGIDTAKFEGQLQEVPLERANDGALPSFVIKFGSVSMETGISGSSEINLSSHINNDAPRAAAATTDLAPRDGLPVTLVDTGAPSILLPAASLQMLATAAMVFRFNNDAIAIRAPMDTLVMPQALVQDARPGQCVLPVFPSQDTAVMGLPMLQSAHVVFDMDGEKLLMAQTKFNVTESSLRKYP
ncbi:hypothetical protein VDGE_03297 [Verticillium dahliae]|uniref:Peptidase A1 domain-containing protein n=1 Tax=Verticillium dahliae TaxID=27337 RepID=A0A444RY11_VERDA|nr:hypothetical protein VDGE_03297 [Verticillium dahliae]